MHWQHVHVCLNNPLSTTHMTLNQSNASESITRLSIKSLIAHFSAHYLDNAHFSKINGCFGVSEVSSLDTSLQCITGFSALGQSS